MKCQEMFTPEVFDVEIVPERWASASESSVANDVWCPQTTQTRVYFSACRIKINKEVQLGFHGKLTN